MSEILLTCRGFDLGGCHVPAFELRRGGSVTLQLPARFEMADTLTASLSGALPRAEIDLHGRCIVARRAEPPSDWLRWFADPFPADWLVRQGFSPDEAGALLARHGIDNRHRLSRYAATPRTLLGIEAAYRSAPDVVVFNTSGLDAVGELAVQELVRGNLNRTSAIYLATPFLSDGSLHRRSMPGSTIVEIAARPLATV